MNRVPYLRGAILLFFVDYSRHLSIDFYNDLE